MVKTVSGKLVVTVVCRINQRDEGLETQTSRKPLAMIQEGNKNLTRVVVATERKTGTRDTLERETI